MQRESLPPDALIQEIVPRLVRALGPERVVLFGSHARGEAGPESDFDFLIVVPHSELPGHARHHLALRCLRGLPVAVDPIVLTHEEFERKRRVVCSLPATVDREGQPLYAA